VIWRPLSQSPLPPRRSPGVYSARGHSPRYSRGSTIRRDRGPSAWRRCGPAWCTRFRSVRPRWPRCWLSSPPGANDWPRRRCSPDHRRCNRRHRRPPAATCGWTCLRCSSSTWNLEREMGDFTFVVARICGSLCLCQQSMFLLNVSCATIMSNPCRFF